MELKGAQSTVRVKGYGPQTGRANYLVGSRDQWLTEIPLYGAVRTIENSNCRLNPEASSATGASNNVTLNLAIVFKPALQCTLTIHMSVGDNASLTRPGSRCVPGLYPRLRSQEQRAWVFSTRVYGAWLTTPVGCWVGFLSALQLPFRW
jgi:hypothetical protein